MEDLYIGKLLDNRYEILEQIGSGGMAMVYMAKCHRLNRMVALKILKPDLAQDAEFRRRFHDESQAVAMLSHPNIVAVYDVSKSSDLEYIVMELIDGITLKQYMHRKGEPLNWREALHFITQIVKALGHAHSRGIIHRDIKPQNIMVLRDGSVKVADFGIARLTSAQQSTLTQEALGSVHYISPEQARGSRIDSRSDLYSVGVVLYEMLTGRLPFEGDSPVSVAIQHISSIPLPPRELNQDIPEALEAITMKAMASNMNQRYLDAGEMLGDLEEFRKNPNINFEYKPEDLIPVPGEEEPTQAIPMARPGPKSSHRSEDSREEYEEYEEEFETARKRKRSNLGPLLMGVGAILIFFIGIGYFIWVTFLSGLLEPTVQYTIPTLVGRNLVDIYMDANVTETFTIEQGGLVFNDSVPAGQVITQEPLAGEKRKQGEDLTIVVQVSAGQESIQMEDLANLEYREALLKIQELGLKADTAENVPSDTVAKGYVISQTPREGTEMAPGDIVHLIVSTGPADKKRAVVDFTGVSLDEAKRMIAQSELVLGEVKPVPDMSLAGTVLEQSEKIGTEVSQGTLIHLTVSLGPDEDEIPPEFSPSPSPDTPTPSPSPGTPTPSPSPSDTPVVAPVTPSPSPTPNYKSIPVDLGGGDGTVQVTITVGGKSAYDNVAGRNLGPVNLKVPGTGVQEVKVYLDGVLVDTRTVDFSS